MPMFQRFMLPPSAGLKCMFMKLYALHCCLPIEVLDVWFEVSIAMQIEVGGFWIVAPCRIVVGNQAMTSVFTAMKTSNHTSFL
jgi:hypothetical protein